MRPAIIFLLFSFSVFGQITPPITAFTANVQGDKVNLFWTVGKSNATCNGLELQRSTDSLFNYTMIYNYSGICGNPTNDQYFQYQDISPFLFQKNYYRILLYPASYSNVLVVDMSKGGSDYKVFPNPVIDFSTLSFNNPSGKEYVIDICDRFGNRIYYQENIRTNTFLLMAGWFEKSGVYPFRMYTLDGSDLIKGKFTVVKNN